MRILVIFFCIPMLIFACNAPSSDSTESNTEVNTIVDDTADPIAGAWGITKRITIQEGDTIINEDFTDKTNERQYKVYAHGHYMWTIPQPKDSAALHAIGTYELDGKTLIEIPISSSAFVNEDMARFNIEEYKIEVEFEENQYTQILYNLAVNEIAIEIYERLPNSTPTSSDPINGVWGLTEVVRVTEGDTTQYSNPQNQFKIYAHGHFMWARSVPKDSAALHGFGTYEMAGDTLIEKPICYSPRMNEYIADNDIDVFKLLVNFNGDQYTQTVSLPESQAYNTEKYQRMTTLPIN